MGINLTQFAKEQGANQGDVEQLLCKLYQRPPPPFFSPSCEHLSTKYLQNSEQDIEIAAIAATILQRQFDAFLNPRNALFLATSRKLFGDDQSSKASAMHAFLFSRISTFMYSGLGACAFRASYASVMLAALPKESHVYLVSIPSKDQFVVQLRRGKKEWFIYDPLLNPEMIFPFKNYHEEVLPQYKDRATQARKFKLRITNELSDEFFSKWPDILAKIALTFTATIATQDEIMNDSHFLRCISYQGIDIKTDKVSSALTLVHTIVSSQNSRLFCPLIDPSFGLRY